MKVGDTVFWKWGNGFADAKIISIEYKTTEIESKNSRITRHGTRENPALVLKNNKDVYILKLQSEVQAGTTS